jgi:hypothetical protein
MIVNFGIRKTGGGGQSLFVIYELIVCDILEELFRVIHAFQDIFDIEGDIPAHSGTASLRIVSLSSSLRLRFDKINFQSRYITEIQLGS